MKRCPQCEFIYEDDQSLCDMDGALLVLDSRTLPNLSALTPYPEALPERTPRRNRAVPAFATLILTMVLVAVYYVSVQRNAVPNNHSPAETTTTSSEMPGSFVPTIEPTPALTGTPADAGQIPQPVETEADGTAGTSNEKTKPAKAKPVTTAPVKKSALKPGVSQPEAKKEESKVGSILKKTGRILKKPFKF